MNPLPSDQTVEYGTPFNYDVNATDDTAIDTYFINDTTNFAINPTIGLITNNTILSIGTYDLNISVNDTSNNIISQIITITVSDAAAPDIYLENPDNSSTDTDGSVVFEYNVTDESSGISFCELIINGVIDQNDTSITEGTTQNFTKT